MYNVVIIGSGCAGLTAAIYAGRANLKPLVLDGHEPGGQLSLTTHVENFQGLPDGILGPELIQNMRKQAEKFGAEFKAGAVTEVDLTKRPFKIHAGKEVYEAKTLIVAAGASARLLGLKNEREVIGHGVSPCDTCEGDFFRGKPTAVVEEILAKDGLVTGVRLRNPQTKEARELAVDGVFVAIGHDPNTAVFRGKLDMDENGYLLAKHGSLSNIPGVFVAGDVQDHRYRQAVTAAGSGCMAALDAEKFLEEHSHE